MKDKIIKILTEIRPEFEFKDDQNFVTNGYLDSFDVISLVTSLDEEFGISIYGTDVLPDNFDTLDSIEQLIKKYLAAK